MRSPWAGPFVAALLVCCEREPARPAAPQLTAAAVREAAGKLTLCKTTEDELRRALGPPFRDGRIAAGRVASWTPAGNDAAHYLAVLLRDGLVVDVYFDAPSEVPWNPADRCPR
ncbi:MAG TPA: hypothetical protein VLW85_14950 [Myxococcales bacterium]|nr:hypothetical protein [Myxococcales bacterium]